MTLREFANSLQTEELICRKVKNTMRSTMRKLSRQSMRTFSPWGGVKQGGKNG